MRSAPKLNEKHVQGQVRDFMKAHGWRPVRTQFAFVQGAMQTGEPGMPDMLFLRPSPGQYAGVLAVWVEFKSPNSRMTCRCEPGKTCRMHKQEQWHQKERARGFVVWSGVDDFTWFEDQYRQYFGWLHAGDRARGQLDLLAGAMA